ncbi:hypothetical protein ABZX30_08370 [Streptomyces sp. NPDC004542]|uniref:hypothetical protein n=1 Tax=Streptomyces sp. NPDC004542 TaxID=3154281 RepID=UPI00339EB4F1
MPDAVRFVRSVYRHGKPIGALGSGAGILSGLEPEGLRVSTEFPHMISDRGVVTDTAPGAAHPDFTGAFVAAIAAHRHWGRPPLRC